MADNSYHVIESVHAETRPLPANMVRRKQRSCHQCRARHLRCDMQQPTCDHCRRGARSCSKESDHVILGDNNVGIVRRRTRYDLSFDEDQTWIGLPPVTFTGVSFPIVNVGRISSNIPWSETVNHVRDSSVTNLSVPAHSIPEGTYRASSHTGSGPSSIALDNTLSNRPSNTLWPFKTQQEAALMRYYVTDLTPWFDHSDTIKHFGSVLPTLAVTCPPLLNAIFAIASQHLSLMGKLDSSISLHCQDECFRTLLPDLKNKAFEAPMLAAVSIIRITVHMTDRPTNHAGIHDTVLNGFLGLDILVDAWRQNPSSTLHAALFMNALRLYIHVALVNKRPLPQVIPSCCLTSSISPNQDDPRVINARITVLVARILDYCYDDEPKIQQRWQGLYDNLAEWKSKLPASFQPMLETLANASQPFGSILFANDVHAASHQYYCLAKQLLVNQTPNHEEHFLTPQGISSPETAFQNQQKTVLDPINKQAETIDLLRRACAVAESHTDTMGIVLMSTLPVFAYGHLLQDRESQERALAILQKAQSNFAALTPPGTNDRLRKHWGWADGVMGAV